MSFARVWITALLAGLCSSVAAQHEVATAPPAPTERTVGPYNVVALQGGTEFVRTIPTLSDVLRPGGRYTLSLWLDMSTVTSPDALIAGMGDFSAEDSVFFGLKSGHPLLRLNRTQQIACSGAMPSTGWHFLAATSDGTHTFFFSDGKACGQLGPTASALAPRLTAAPLDDAASDPAAEHFLHFGGRIAALTLKPRSTPADTMRLLASTSPDVSLLRFDEASPAWPVQTRGQRGYSEQQDPSLLPHSHAPFSLPSAKPLPRHPLPTLAETGPGVWELQNNWRLLPEPEVHAEAAMVSSAAFDVGRWLPATLPGTVLTTMVDRGLYPDPDFRLNNLAIPESLNKQNYWYRLQFNAPPAQGGTRAELNFAGINYAAEVWLNGKRLGEVRGAFRRGVFDVSGLLERGQANVLAVRVFPPPHPGIPNEQSLLGGPGENGGSMVLDGPTFVASEGWDWIPAIRDRNTGIWQPVELRYTKDITLGDAQVITHLPLPEISTADLEIDVPLTNHSPQVEASTLHVGFEGVDFSTRLTVPAGQTVVAHLTAAEFSQLHLPHPRLWWPNGYGRPELYHLKLATEDSTGASDQRTLTFGVREVTYELSLFDSTGRLQRVEVNFTAAHARREQIVDVTHEGMRRRSGGFAAASLTPAGEHSGAVVAVADEPGLTDLVLKVNGVRIAARGGNWGMDDSRKRVSREHLEPFFRLHREANVNIIRNWVGQNTEETFYQLADEYGLMVWNDFWESTQDYNLEAEDVPLFLDNARDVVRRFRNHPSIVLWCGRNEGVPQPVLNRGLIDLLQQEDGTRYYTPGSNRINLRNSGPYKYQDPRLYFTTLDKGFSVELGISSLSTLESLQASIAPADQWPVSDAWAYHDWHWSGNGDVHPFLEAMNRQFGAATGLKDFERKAQMLNYVHHRAIFEGFNQHLWQPNSGRMLWMTQPAWPSNSWQIFSSDYDTNASFFAVKKACEPLHVQLDLSNFALAVVNTTRDPVASATVHARIVSLDNRSLFEQDLPVRLPANATTPLPTLPVGRFFDQEGVVLVELTLRDASGVSLSRNLYWLAADDAQLRKLNTLAPAVLTSSASTHADPHERVLDLTLENTGSTPALAIKATVVDGKSGQRILPAFYSDNYVSLLPGQRTVISIHLPQQSAHAEVRLRGWNLLESTMAVSEH